MAVPAADGGSLTPHGRDAEPGTSQHDQAPRGWAVRAVASAVLLAVALAAAVVLIIGAFDDEETQAGDGQAAREALMARATEFVVAVNSYGPADLDEQNRLTDYAAKVKAVITPKFGVSFDDGLRYAEQTVAQAGYARTVQIFSSGVASTGPTSAQVLVAGQFSGSYPDPQDTDRRLTFEPDPFRLEVSLVRIDGEWLVDDFTPLTGQDTDPGQAPVPDDGASEPSPSPQTSTPTGTPRPGGAASPTEGSTP
ncbi:hypothetical protein [Nocardioides sp. R-C-SC26]|uniref:hypothetical protein n=1 Tax=Nocardioides sp. R-C-SC26 TaxID=2870414 RepID=UPI001E33753D|nr:hypothetical protein [Nocardioides sp. R-C-SC26]